MDLLTWFLIALKGSLLSTGGFGPLPIIHDDMIAQGWATERMFTEALAIGQASPGPNGLWVVSLGYFVGGVPGGVLAVLGMAIPPLLVIAVERVYARHGNHIAMRGFLDGMAIAVGVLGLAIFGKLWQGDVFDPRSLGIFGAALVLAASKRVPVVGIIALAATAGVVLY
jgi:chromate transporter